LLRRAAAPSTLMTVPITVVTAISRIVMPAPRAMAPDASYSQPKSRL
jgi:hypothetical protein